MDFDIADVVIEPLEQTHVREAFCCTQPRINTFLQTRALNDHRSYKVRVFVACLKGDLTVLGFYSLSLTSLVNELKGKAKQKFGNWPIPAVYLSMVGTTEAYEGKKIGKLLMLNAFERTVLIAENAGTYCLTLDAVNQERAAWYERLQFQRMSAGSLKMYVPIPTIKAALDG